MVTLRGRHRVTYFYLRELDLSSRSPADRQAQHETVDYYAKRLQGGVSNRLEVNQARPTGP